MFLGLDLGTSGLRALLVDAGGTPVAGASHALSVSRPAAGWSEQDPGHWIEALRSVMETLRADHTDKLTAVRGLAVSGHMHGATLLDKHGEVLRPCILWNDTRSAALAEELDQHPAFRKVSGNIVFPGFTAPKLLWVYHHEPEVFARIDKVLLPAAYLNFWLTGVHASDRSDSAGTSWLDLETGDWSDTLLGAGQMTRAQMPGLFHGTEPIATLRADVAQDLGLPATVVVAAGAGDNAASACGVGALSEGQGFVSLGTSGVVLSARDTCAPLPESAVHTFCHAVPDRWYQMGVTLAATDSLNWLSRITGQTPQQLSEALGPDVGPPGQIRFLPYLSGERTPHNDARIRGAFLGLGSDHDTADLTRAVMEGVAYSLRESLDALRQTGAQISDLLAIGGGFSSPYWSQLMSNILDLPLLKPVDGDFGAALGAARLAICAATDANPNDMMVRPDIQTRYTPDPAMRAAVSDSYAAYRATYPAIKALP